MKLLCSSNSIAFAQSLRIALEAEDIETFCSNPDLALGSIAGPVAGGGGRVYVLHESDWPRAVEILEHLSPRSEPTARPAEPKYRMPRWFVFGLVATGTALLVWLLGTHEA
jgi:hypothetical protein